MSQSEKIGMMILLGYVVYTTINGNLITWLRMLGLKRRATGAT